VHEGDRVRFAIHGFHNVAYLPHAMAPPSVVIPMSRAPVGGPPRCRRSPAVVRRRTAT
jgi:hypothetical protein